jgi:RNA polymerase sigma-70 factor (ECF subfamily)
MRATDGDLTAFGILYEHYLDAIYRYIFFRIGNAAEAEDLTEEVFVSAWKNVDTFEPGSERSFAAWLYRIARNLVIDHYRKRRPENWSAERFATLDTGSLSLDEVTHRRQDEIRLAQAVQRLEDVEQEVIILRFVEGLSHREIASIIDKSEGASRVIQYRALSNLRHLLSRNESGTPAAGTEE